MSLYDCACTHIVPLSVSDERARHINFLCIYLINSIQSLNDTCDSFGDLSCFSCCVYCFVLLVFLFFFGVFSFSDYLFNVELWFLRRFSVRCLLGQWPHILCTVRRILIVLKNKIYVLFIHVFLVMHIQLQLILIFYFFAPFFLVPVDHSTRQKYRVS